jgi:hypothetical protein
MAPVRMVEVAADQIIHVVGMGDHVVPTARGVRMRLLVLLAGVRWGAGHRVAAPGLEAALIDVVTMGTVEVPLMHVSAVVAVLDDSVATARAVGVGMSCIGVMFCHGLHSSRFSRIIAVGHTAVPDRYHGPPISAHGLAHTGGVAPTIAAVEIRAGESPVGLRGGKHVRPGALSARADTCEGGGMHGSLWEGSRQPSDGVDLIRLDRPR